MGKVKKVIDNKKQKKFGNVISGIRKIGGILKSEPKKFGLILTSTKNTLKEPNDVNSRLTKSLKKSNSKLLKQAKSSTSKSKGILSPNKTADVAKTQSTMIRKKSGAKRKKNKAVDIEISTNQIKDAKLTKLLEKKNSLESRKLKENKLNRVIKGTTSFKNKTKPFKVKTASILYQKSHKIDQIDDSSIPPHNVEENSVRSGINALFKVIEECKDDKSLFEGEVPIFLHFSTIKIGKTPSRTLRIPLKHTLLKDTSEVCLITDDKRGHLRKDFEKTIEHYEKLFQEKGVDKIKTIMPFFQLRTEYSEFELKRKLVELYDMFLVDAKISGYTVKKLGKIFMNKRKLPIPVRLDVNNLKDTIDFALRKTSTNLHPHGDNFIIQIGHSEMTEDQIYENFDTACINLSKQFPGGWDNIRALNLKTPKSLSIPVYYTLKNPSEFPTPVVKAKRPKAFQTVAGELSTIYDREVEVRPSGEVTIKKTQLNKTTKPSNKGIALNRTEDSGESAEEFGQIYKQVKKSNKKCVSTNVQVKRSKPVKQGLDMKMKGGKVKSNRPKRRTITIVRDGKKTKL